MDEEKLVELQKSSQTWKSTEWLSSGRAEVSGDEGGMAWLLLGREECVVGGKAGR